MSEWRLQLTVERGVTAPSHGPDAPPYEGTLTWYVRPSLPLASDHNLQALAQVLKRESVWDLFLFDGMAAGSPPRGAATDSDSVAADVASGTSKLRFLDPSCTPIALMLRDGAPVLVSAAPLNHVRNPRLLVPLRAALIQFSSHGSAVHIPSDNARRAVRVNRDAWGGGIALCNAPLSNETVNAVTFRITRTTLGNASPSPSKTAADEEEGHRALPDVGDEVPIAAIGLCDGSIDLDSDNATLFGVHPRSWLVEPVSGAIHNGGSGGAKQTFLDVQQVSIAATMTITLLLDSVKGTVFLIECGRPIGGFNVSKVLADSMYPVVELYSRGATVEIL